MHGPDDVIVRRLTIFRSVASESAQTLGRVPLLLTSTMAHHYMGEGWSERNRIPTVQEYLAEKERLNPDESNSSSWWPWPSSNDENKDAASETDLSYLQSSARPSLDTGKQGYSSSAGPDQADVGTASMPAPQAQEGYSTPPTQPQQSSDATSSHSKLSRSKSDVNSVSVASDAPSREHSTRHNLVSDKGGGQEEKERIKEAARASKEPKKNNFVAKGKRKVDDPVTGGEVIIQDTADFDIDPSTLDSRYRGGFSTKKPVSAKAYDAEYVNPSPARPTSILLQRFPEPMKAESLKEMSGIFEKILYGYAAIVILVWGVATVGHGWFAFLTRTILLGIAAFAGYMSIGLVQNKITAEFERIRAHMHKQRGERFAPPYPESVEWLNAAVATIWKQLNPEMFTAALDQVEDIMQSSLPGVVSSVKISDFGMGSNPLRFIAMRALADLMTDKEYPRDMWIERNEDKGEAAGPSVDQVEEKLDDDMGADARRAEAEDLAGDFLNMEVSFCYSALPGQSGKDRSKNVHLLIEFFIGAFDWLEIPLPVWVQVERVVGTVRLRAQIMSEPPFLRNLTFSLMGVPSVSISAIPMTRILPNVLDLPLISNFVQSSIAAAANMYVAPKSMTMNMRQMLSGDGIKKDTDALGVLVVNIHHGEGLSSQDLNGKSDPYCVLSFAKFGRPMYSTRIIFEDLNPVWEETAFLLVSREDVRSDESLSVQLWDSDKRSADDIVGRVNVTLRELVRNPNKILPRLSDLMGFEDADTMEGRLNWSVGFFEKANLNTKLRQNQKDENESAAEQTVDRKPAPIDSEQEALALDTPPDPQWPSGILSVIVKFVAGLERRDVEKGVKEKDREGAAGQDVEMGSSHLPSGYCELILNDNMFYKTRVKQYSNMPYFQAGTEIFVRDWTKSELRIIVRDSRLREHDPIMGIVALPLKSLFEKSSQVERAFSLQDGVGYGKVSCGIVFRSVKLSLPRELRGFNTVSIDLLSNVEVRGKTEELTRKLNSSKVHLIAGLHEKKLGSLKKQPNVGENESLIRMPVYDRYSTNLIFSFGRHMIPGNLVPGTSNHMAVAMLPLRELEDEQVTDIELPILTGNNLHALERNFINKQTTKTHEFEEIGSLSVRVRVNPGLDESHRECLDGARDRHEFEVYERLVGLPQRSEENSHANDDGVITRQERKAIEKLQTQQLHMRHRGAMGYTPVRTAVWAKDGLKSHLRQLGHSMFGGMGKRDQHVQSET